MRGPARALIEAIEAIENSRGESQGAVPLVGRAGVNFRNLVGTCRNGEKG